MSGAVTLYLGLGSNVGDRLAHLRGGVRYLRQRLHIAAASSLYETEPVGRTDQAAFLNAVVQAQTTAPAEQVLAWALAAEAAEGRVRPGEPWGPRTLDVDLLLYGACQIATETLAVPHPRLAERAFVLVPLAELAPQLVHPVLQHTIGTLAARVGSAGVVRVAGPQWCPLQDADGGAR